ncbi:MAG: DUF2063 domain-containing protein [Burkholderiales bacterium]|nr:MAG: DUF2063 domain-containing protein [Burkholderiales bacterium]
MKADQQAFVDAVLGRGGVPPGLRDGRGGLEVYRNNLRALSAQALAVAFGRLRDELGEDDFASLAWTFWRHAPPVSGDLGDWGGQLADFLVERAGEDSGLPDLARLDWALHQAERAAEAPLDAESLQWLGQGVPEALWLVLRPAVQLLVQRDGPVLVWRATWRGEWRRLSTAEAAFFRVVLAGATLAEALTQAEVKGSDAEPDFDFGTWLQAALQNAWLHAVRATPPNATTT